MAASFSFPYLGSLGHDAQNVLPDPFIEQEHENLAPISTGGVFAVDSSELAISRVAAGTAHRTEHALAALRDTGGRAVLKGDNPVLIQHINQGFLKQIADNELFFTLETITGEHITIGIHRDNFSCGTTGIAHADVVANGSVDILFVDMNREVLDTLFFATIIHLLVAFGPFTIFCRSVVGEFTAELVCRTRLETDTLLCEEVNDFLGVRAVMLSHSTHSTIDIQTSSTKTCDTSHDIIESASTISVNPKLVSTFLRTIQAHASDDIVLLGKFNEPVIDQSTVGHSAVLNALSILVLEGFRDFTELLDAIFEAKRFSALKLESDQRSGHLKHLLDKEPHDFFAHKLALNGATVSKAVLAPKVTGSSDVDNNDARIFFGLGEVKLNHFALIIKSKAAQVERFHFQLIELIVIVTLDVFFGEDHPGADLFVQQNSEGLAFNVPLETSESIHFFVRTTHPR